MRDIFYISRSSLLYCVMFTTTESKTSIGERIWGFRGNRCAMGAKRGSSPWTSCRHRSCALSAFQYGMGKRRERAIRLKVDTNLTLSLLAKRTELPDLIHPSLTNTELNLLNLPYLTCLLAKRTESSILALVFPIPV